MEQNDNSGVITKSLDDFKILIATPHSYPSIHKEWFISYEQLTKPSSHKLYMDPNLPLDVNRNNAVREALEMGADHLLFIDHDNILQPNALVRMLQYNVPIVGSLYFERKYPHLPVCYTFEGDTKTVRVMHEYPKGLIRVHVLGLGCSLFNMNVFKQLKDPWFTYTHNGNVWGTEDIAFFHKVMEADIPVYMDTQNTCGHLTNHVIDEGDWLYYKEGFLKDVAQKANELGTNAIFLDKTKNQMIKSPSAQD